MRHLLRALGIDGRVRSPTFTVLEPYSLHRPGQPLLSISHLDLYRFGDPREWLDAGLREVFEQPGLKLVEWPERAAGQLPPADLRLHLLPQGDDSRQVVLQACSALGRELLA